MTAAVERRVLAISWEMPPLVGPRAIQVSRTLDRLATLGWSSTVICVAPRSGGPLLRDAAGPAEPPGPGVELERVPSAEEGVVWRTMWKLVPALGRLPDRKRVWIDPAVRAGVRRAHRERFDALLSFAQPWSDHLIGLRLRRRFGIPWVAHFSDPWTDSPYECAPGWVRNRWRRMEAAVIHEADALVFVNARAADVVMRKYPVEWGRKVRVVPHGFDKRVLARIDPPRVRSDRLTFVYTGRFYDGLRTPLALFKALDGLNQAQPLDGALVVRMIGPRMADYEPLARRLGLSSVLTFSGRRPYVEALTAAAEGDVLLVIDAPSATPSLFLPSKVVDYLMLRKPILGLTPLEGPTADLLRRLDCLVVAPDDVAGIARAVGRLLEDWRRGELCVSHQYDTIAAEYDIENTTRTLAGVLEECGQMKSQV